MAATVVTYTDPNCPHCQRLKRFLDGRGIRYENRDVTTDPAAVADLQRMDAPGVPVTRVGTETVIGFDQARLENVLRDQGVTAGAGA